MQLSMLFPINFHPLLFLLLLLPVVKTEMIQISVSYVKSADRVYKYGTVLDTVVAVSETDCARQCIATELCMSVNMKPLQKEEDEEQEKEKR